MQELACCAGGFANLYRQSQGGSKVAGEDGSTGVTWCLNIKLSHSALDQAVDV